MRPLGLLAAALAAIPAHAQPAPAAEAFGQAVDVFARICVVAPGDIAAQRAALAAGGFRRGAAKDSEIYTAWPLQVTVSDEAGWVQCYLSAPVAGATTMADALKLMRPLAGPGAGETLTGDYVAWERFGAGGFSMRLNLSTIAGGRTAVLSIAARSAP